MKVSTPLLVLAGISVVGLILLIGGFVSVNSKKRTLNAKETELNSLYVDNQNYLSEYVSGFHEQVSLGGAQMEWLDQIMLDAVRGRYESSGGFAPNGAFFSAIKEAYPNLDMSIYNKIVDYVQAKRAEYRGRQSLLLDRLRAYDAWRGDGFIHEAMVYYILGAPTKTLKARIGQEIKTGEDALNQMYVIVLAPEAKAAYKSGEMAPLQVPTREKPAPAASPTATPAAKTEQKRGRR